MSHYILRITQYSPMNVAVQGRAYGWPLYCPVQHWTGKSRHKKGPVSSSRPMFPGYLFLKEFGVLGPPDLSVLSFLTSGKNRLFYLRDPATHIPLKISDEAFLAVVTTEKELNEELSKALNPKQTPQIYFAGDVVRLLNGVLEGRIGTVISSQTKSVLLSLATGGVVKVGSASVDKV